MNILYLGHFLPPQLLKTVDADSKGKIGFSNHNFELSLLNGFTNQTNINLKIISIPLIYSYPYNNKKIYTHKEVFNINGYEATSIGFFNFPFVKECSSIIICAFRILQAIKIFPKGKINVVINTPSARLLQALKLASHLSHRKFTQTVIIPDIPALVESMDHSNSLKKRILNLINRNVMKITERSNGLVVLTQYMMNLFERKPAHIVMEGIVDVHNMDKPTMAPVSDSEIILYSGTLRKVFGVMNLLKAFNLITNPNVQLWICGSGEAAEDIKQAANKDPRIKFFGLVSSSEALELQKKATILVNPRTSEEEFTKYSFPSKTIEYLLAGKSVVINKLPGIPKEYYQYAFTPDDESVESLAKCISQVIDTDKNLRISKAQAGRKFILTQKNSTLQVSRILHLIESYN